MQQDLWEALQTQAGVENVTLPATVETIMETWTRQMGFPVINITRQYDSTNSAVASQVIDDIENGENVRHYLISFILFHIYSKDSC